MLMWRIHYSKPVPSSPWRRREFGVVAARSTFPRSLQVPKEETSASGGVWTSPALGGFWMNNFDQFIGNSSLCTSHVFAMDVILGSIWLGSNHARASCLSDLGARSSDRFTATAWRMNSDILHLHTWTCDMLVLHDANIYIYVIFLIS